MSRDSRKNRKSLDKIICEIWAEQPVYFPSTRIKAISKHAAKRIAERWRKIPNPSEEKIERIIEESLNKFHSQKWIFGGKGNGMADILVCEENNRHILLSFDGEVITVYKDNQIVERCKCFKCRERRKKKNH